MRSLTCGFTVTGPGFDVVHVYVGDQTLVRHNWSCADQNTGSTRRRAVTRNR